MGTYCFDAHRWNNPGADAYVLREVRQALPERPPQGGKSEWTGCETCGGWAFGVVGPGKVPEHMQRGRSPWAVLVEATNVAAARLSQRNERD